MNFIGTGKRLQQGDIGKVAKLHGLTTSVLLAVIEIESAGRGFGRKNRLKVLFEPHVFYRRLKGSQRAEAIRKGLAYKSWGAKPYPKTFDARYRQISSAQNINKEVALQSASWGLPQMMGFNHKAAGFNSASQMVITFMQGEYEQLLGMMSFIKFNGLLKHLKGKNFNLRKSWEPFANGYNGSGFRKHNYHGRLARSHKKHDGLSGHTTVPQADGMLRKGMKGEPVREMQADLALLDMLRSPVDGVFGPQTELDLRLFQRTYALKVDGIAGPKTLALLKTKSDAVEEVVEPETPVPNIGWDRALINFIVNLLQGIVK